MSHLIAGKYEVLEEIGQSAAGITYKVRHALRDSIFTLTVLPELLTKDPVHRVRIRSAVERAASLRHDHIAQVIDLGYEERGDHIAETFVDGERLDCRLRQSGPLPPALVLHIAGQLADALGYAHARGVVHGALTPASVVIGRSVPPRAVLCGFAAGELVWAQDAPPSSLLPYAAPERLAPREERKGMDERIDIFALGLLIFEMLEGKAFFAGAGERDIVERLRHGSGPLLPRFSRIVPSGVPALVAHAIRRKPAERQQSMAVVRREIEACLQRIDPGKGVASVNGRKEAAVNGRKEAADSSRVSRLRPVVRVTPDPRLLEEDETDPAPGEAVSPIPAPEVSSPRRMERAANSRTGAPRRRIPVARVALLTAVLLATGGLLFRPVRTAPATPERVSMAPQAAEEAAAEQPASAELAAVAIAAPVPAVAAGVPGATADVPAVAADGPEPAVLEAAVERPRPQPNVAPRIVSFQPRRRDTLSVTEGAPVDFRVRVSDRNRDDRVAYAWFLDGRRVGRQASWRFVSPLASAGTAHTVAVEVSDRAGLKAPRLSWNLEVTARMSAVNVRDWLDRLAAAWSRKDLATLRLYGIVTSTEAEALRKELSGCNGCRVSIGNETVRTNGKYAAVAFDRADFDKRGKLLASRRESYELEKHPNGFIAVRAH